MSTPSLLLRTLGGLAIERDGRAIVGPATQPRRLAVLALVARAGERGITRDKLLALLWPDADEDGGRRSLTQAIYAIRRDLGAEDLLVGVKDLRLNADLATSDVAAFERALAARDLERAVELYGGPFLDGFRLPGSDVFDRWVEEERAALAQRHADALDRLARAAGEQGDADGAVRWWRRRAALDPLDGRVAAALMRALAAAGDRSAALQHARVYEVLVAQELDMPPDRDVVRLAASLRAEADAAPKGAAPAAPPPPVATVADPVAAAPVTEPVPAPGPTAVATSPATVEPEPRAAPAAAAHRAPRRWRRAAGLLAAGVAAAVIGAVALGAGRGPATWEVGETRHLTFDPGLELDPALSPDGRVVAYAGGAEGAMRLLVRQLAGGRAIAVTGDAGPGDQRRPRWSPDGTRLLFQAERAVWMVPALGGEPQLAVEAPADSALRALYPTWSPDGRALAWVVRDTVFVRALDGGPARILGVLTEAHSLAWSPDGRWIAAVSGNPPFLYGASVLARRGGTAVGNLAPSAIHLLPAGGGAPVPVTGGEHLNTSPEWLGDGRTLVFVSNRGGARDLWTVALAADGRPAGAPTRLTTGLDAHGVTAAGDGRTLAYSIFRQTANVWSVDVPAAGEVGIAAATPVTTGAQTIEAMDLSPDGRWLAFDTDRGGRQDIYRMATAGGEPEPLVTGPDDDFHPAWSPDGRWVAFHTFRAGVRRAAIVSAQGGAVRLVSADTAAGEEKAPAWTPDGRRLVFDRNLAGGPQLFEVARTADGGWSAARPLTREGGVSPAFSADGRRMAYLTGPGRLWLMALDEGEASRRSILTDSASGILAVHARWAPDDASLLVKGVDAEGQGGFWRVPLDGGAPRRLVRLDDPLRPSPRPEFATDGRRLLFTLAEREADVWTVRLAPR